MKTVVYLSGCVLTCSLSAVSVRAQSAAGPESVQAAPVALSTHPQMGVLSLRAALDAAWALSITAQESGGQRRRAEADRAVAGSYWAAPPSLQLSYRDDRLQRNLGKREAEVGVAVPLWLPGQRLSRARVNEAAVAQAIAGEHVARLELAGALREAAWQIDAIQAESFELDNQLNALTKLVSDVERRVRAGDLAPVDTLVAQAERQAANAVLLDVQQRLRAARARWALLTGLSAAPNLAVAMTTDASPEGLATLAQHPELQLAAVTAELARKRLDLVRHSRRDAPELSIGLSQELPGGPEASQGSLIVGFKLPFLTDDRNRPLEASALAELGVAETQELRLRERLDSGMATARDAQETAASQLAAEMLRARLLNERATLIDKAFRAGEMPLPELLRAFATASQANSAVARQKSALGLAHARFQQSLGLLP